VSHDTVFSPPKASGGVHEQIESFLETVMQGLMGPHDQASSSRAADKPGRPVVCQCEVVDGSTGSRVRGLKSQRAIWRLLAAGSWWKAA